MRIVIATGNFGGPAVYSKLLADKLPSYGYKVVSVSFGEVLKYPRIIRHLIYFLKLFFKSFSADIIYAQDPVSVGLPALFASKILGKRFFLKIVGDYAWEQGQQRWGVTDLLDDFVKKKKEYPLSVRFLKRTESFVANGAEKIIVPSNYLKEIVCNWGTDKEKISVVYNAFVKPRISESKEDLRRKLNYAFPTVISIGRLVPWKNFPVLIKAFSEVSKKFIKAELHIIDDGPEKNKLQRMVKELGLESKVKFLGHISHKEVYERIKTADVFVLVSSYEGFSHLLLETLAIGTPVVTTPVGGNVEIIRNEENGIMVPAGDADQTKNSIIRILEDKNFASILSQKGQKSAESFSEENMLKNLSKILR